MKENEKIISKDSKSIEENNVNLEAILDEIFGAIAEANKIIKIYPPIIVMKNKGSKN